MWKMEEIDNKITERQKDRKRKQLMEIKEASDENLMKKWTATTTK